MGFRSAIPRLRLWQATGLPLLRSRLEVKPQTDVDVARRADAGRCPEEPRRQVARVSGLRHAVENVLRLHEHLHAVARVARSTRPATRAGTTEATLSGLPPDLRDNRADREAAAEIQVQPPRRITAQRVAANALRAIVEYAVVVVVETRGHGVRHARADVEIEVAADAEEQRQLRLHLHAMADVLPRRAPVDVRIQAVRGERRGAIGMILLLAERVVHVEHYRLLRLQRQAEARSDGYPIALRASRRFELRDVAEGRVRPHAVHRRVDVARAHLVLAAQHLIRRLQHDVRRQLTVVADRRLMDA